ncbi:SDR family oxidoreductase [Sinomonas sp. P10A9]|uniref:SDR family oxidoreductase n=1 Tax=Sinomonas puerhi TaxID=3238584 RepID=A0AB39L1U0_9MICC
MILVVGGTGNLGRELVPALVRRGDQVRVMARGASRPFTAAATDSGPHGAGPRETGPDSTNTGGAVELFRGDLASEADCRRAVEGCDQVVFAASGFGIPNADPRAVDRDGAVRLVRAAAEAGVEHVVMMSMHGAAADAPIEYLRCKAAAEEAVRGSGMSWTIVRLGAILEQRLAIMGAGLEAKGRVPVFGSGASPVTFTSARDAAAVVVRALNDPVLRNRVIEWGSETLTANEVADALIAKAGRGSVRRIPTPALRIMSVAAKPFSPFLARVAGAGVWEDSGDESFDPAAARAEFPDIPITRLREVVASQS